MLLFQTLAMWNDSTGFAFGLGKQPAAVACKLRVAFLEMDDTILSKVWFFSGPPRFAWRSTPPSAGREFKELFPFDGEVTCEMPSGCLPSGRGISGQTFIELA